MEIAVMFEICNFDPQNTNYWLWRVSHAVTSINLEGWGGGVGLGGAGTEARSLYL
jgi:hypothetical protein